MFSNVYLGQYVHILEQCDCSSKCQHKLSKAALTCSKGGPHVVTSRGQQWMTEILKYGKFNFNFGIENEMLINLYRYDIFDNFGGQFFWPQLSTPIDRHFYINIICSIDKIWYYWQTFWRILFFRLIKQIIDRIFNNDRIFSIDRIFPIDRIFLLIYFLLFLSYSEKNHW